MNNSNLGTALAMGVGQGVQQYTQGRQQGQQQNFQNMMAMDQQKMSHKAYLDQLKKEQQITKARMNVQGAMEEIQGLDPSSQEYPSTVRKVLTGVFSDMDLIGLSDQALKWMSPQAPPELETYLGQNGVGTFSPATGEIAYKYWTPELKAKAAGGGGISEEDILGIAVKVMASEGIPLNEAMENVLASVKNLTGQPFGAGSADGPTVDGEVEIVAYGPDGSAVPILVPAGLPDDELKKRLAEQGFSLSGGLNVSGPTRSLPKGQRPSLDQGLTPPISLIDRNM